ncbi:GAF domain-containing protein [Lentzea sp. NPDC006480]|uniref:GAF domain-containing protein n=1 Tax=Lentzea sp. NPDC006480 TaxID=3157176 RepID=UPI0033A408C3
MSLDLLLDSVIATAQHLTGSSAGSVALLDGDELVFRAASGPKAAAIIGLRLPVGRGIAGYAVSSGQAVALDDVSADPRFARDLAESLGHVPHGIVAVPLDTDDEVVGVLELLDPAGSAALDVLSLLARQAALAVVLARSFDALAGDTEAAALAVELSRLGTRERALLRAFLDYAG